MSSSKSLLPRCYCPAWHCLKSCISKVISAIFVCLQFAVGCLVQENFSLYKRDEYCTNVMSTNRAKLDHALRSAYIINVWVSGFKTFTCNQKRLSRLERNNSRKEISV